LSPAFGEDFHAAILLEPRWMPRCNRRHGARAVRAALTEARQRLSSDALAQL